MLLEEEANVVFEEARGSFGEGVAKSGGVSPLNSPLATAAAPPLLAPPPLAATASTAVTATAPKCVPRNEFSVSKVAACYR